MRRIYVVARHDLFRIFQEDHSRHQNLTPGDVEFVHIGRSDQLRGIQLRKGDELVNPFGLGHISQNDYPHMIEIMRHREATRIL